MVDAYTFARLALNGLSEPPLPRGIRLKVEIDPELPEVAVRAYWIDDSDQMRTALVRWTDGHRCSVADALDALRRDIAHQLVAHGAPRTRS